jgi:hypothetical protein
MSISAKIKNFIKGTGEFTKLAGSEFVGKAMFEKVQGVFGSTVEEAAKKMKDNTEFLEQNRSRVLDALLELKDEASKIWEVYQKICRKELKTSNGKTIGEDRFILVLGKLQENRLKSTLRLLNTFPEEKLILTFELLDQDWWGDTWHNFWKKAKEVWLVLAVILINFSGAVSKKIEEIYNDYTLRVPEVSDSLNRYKQEINNRKLNF